MKLLSPRVLASLDGYRLGYSPQQLFLTCVNFPLSAYEVVQEITYFPNATLNELPMSNLIPSFLRDTTVSFAPQTWSVGDTFRLNNSIFQFIIASAFDPVDDMEPVNSFSYSNVAFSENCDVTNVTVNVKRTVDTQSPEPFQYYICDASAYVTCNLPTLVELTATLPDSLGFASTLQGDGEILTQVNHYGLDLQAALYVHVLFGGPAGVPDGEASITITARPCCNCSSENSEDFLAAEAQALVQQPCSSQPSRFVASSGIVKNSISDYPWGMPYTPAGANATDLFDGLSGEWRDGYVGSGELSVLNDPFRNMFQVYYHLLRRDLGVLLDNQIYSSPDMYNRSITLINPGVGMEGTPFGTIGTWAAHTYRALSANETLMEYLSKEYTYFATASRDAEWEASKDRPSLGLDESKWSFKGIGSFEEVSLTTAHEEHISNDVREQIAALRREIYSIRGLLQRRGLSESE
ncbi:hypothetical protein C8R45DRAFT_945069 [Mycena sanguinolenta]|nr:hypothetical protein C8R45DRAFT_945069 [Mycena sanguinolenta]